MRFFPQPNSGARPSPGAAMSARTNLPENSEAPHPHAPSAPELAAPHTECGEPGRVRRGATNDGSRGLQPTVNDEAGRRRGATLDQQMSATIQASLRDADPHFCPPWAKAHGYLHSVAPRQRTEASRVRSSEAGRTPIAPARTLNPCEGGPSALRAGTCRMNSIAPQPSVRNAERQLRRQLCLAALIWRSKSVRVTLHLAGMARRPRNFRWHWHCITREFHERKPGK